MKYGLEDSVLVKINHVFEQFPQIKEVIIYGSRAMGNYREASDIDLTLTGENLNLSILNQLSEALDNLLLPYLFDISIYQQIKNQDLLDHITRKGQTFYSLVKVMK
jgi:predicted nucleotidyltransferase